MTVAMLSSPPVDDLHLTVRRDFVSRRASSPVATNKPGPFARRPAAAGRSRIRSKPASFSSRLHVVVGEPEPHVAHLLPVALAIVRQHVDDDERGRPA